MNDWWKILAIGILGMGAGIFFWPKSEPDVFWQAVEAIAVVGAGLAIYIDVRKFRKENIAGKIQGYDYAMEKLFDNLFFTAQEKIRQAWIGESKEDAEFVMGDIAIVIARLNIAYYLIKKDYMDIEMLFFSIGEELHSLDLFLINFERTGKIEYLEIARRTRDKGAFRLLGEASKWVRKSNRELTRETFDAIEKNEKQ